MILSSILGIPMNQQVHMGCDRGDRGFLWSSCGINEQNGYGSPVARMSLVLSEFAIMCAFSVTDLPCTCIHVLQSIPIIFQSCQATRVRPMSARSSRPDGSATFKCHGTQSFGSDLARAVWTTGGVAVWILLDGRM